MTDDEALRTIAHNLRRLRGDTSLAEIARRAGTYPTSIKRIEDGDHLPGVGLLSRIADALGVEIGDMLARPRTRSRQPA